MRRIVRSTKGIRTPPHMSKVKCIVLAVLALASSCFGSDVFGLQDVEWTDLVNTTSVANGRLKKTAGGTASWNADAVSRRKISGDGCVQFSCALTNSPILVGLSTLNSNRDWDTLDYAIYAKGDGTLDVRENGVVRAILPTDKTYTNTDILRVQRSGATVSYWRVRGGVETLLYTSTVKSFGRLLIDTSFYSVNGEILNCQYRALPAAEEVLWNAFSVQSGGAAGVSATYTTYGTGSRLDKEGPGTAWDGAIGSKMLTGDGYFAFKFGQNNDWAAAGLSFVDSDYTVDSIGYGFEAISGTAQFRIVEPGIRTATTSAYTTADVFRVQRVGNKIQFFQNDYLLKTSTVLCSSGPMFPDVALRGAAAFITNCQIGGVISPSEKVVWTALANAAATYPSNRSTITNSSAIASWTNSGALSVKPIRGEGFVRFRFGSANKAAAIGLSDFNAGVSLTDIKFAIRANADGTCQVIESGTPVGSARSYQPEDYFVIRRASGKIQYFQNGDLFTEHTTSEANPLSVDVSLYDIGATIANCEYVGVPEDIIWGNWSGTIGKNPTPGAGSSLTFNNTATTWSDALSAQCMTGDGYVEWCVDNLNKQMGAGLSAKDDGASITTTDFAIYASTTAVLTVREDNAIRYTGTYAAGDLFRVQRIGTQIKYYQKSGAGAWTLIYTSAIASTGPLFADGGIYNGGSMSGCVIWAKPLDSDSDGLADDWEFLHFGVLTQAGASGSNFDFDDYSDAEEFSLGLNPVDYYNGNVPAVGKVSGDNQTVVPGRFGQLPLVADVRDTAGGLLLADAPVTFTGASLALDNAWDSTVTSELSTRTGVTTGLAQVFSKGAGPISVTGGGATPAMFSVTLDDKAAWWRFDEAAGADYFDISGASTEHHGRQDVIDRRPLRVPSFGPNVVMPVVRWEFEDQPAVTVRDTSGNGLAATKYPIAGSQPMPAVGSDGIGLSLKFDGVDDYLELAHSDAINLGVGNEDFAVAFWVKPATNGAGNWRPLIYKGANATDHVPGIWLHPSENRIRYYVTTTASADEGGSSQAVLPSGVWSHVVLMKETIDGVAGFKLFVNGQFDSGVVLAGTVVPSSGPLRIGADAGALKTAASLDDIQIFRESLSAYDLALLALPKQRQSMAPGGRALYFDGADDGVPISVPSTQVVSSGSKITLMAWVQVDKSLGLSNQTRDFYPIFGDANTASGSDRRIGFGICGGDQVGLYAGLENTGTGEWWDNPSSARNRPAWHPAIDLKQTLIDGRPHHVAVTFSGSMTISLFLDGVMVASTTDSKSWDSVSSYGCIIGADVRASKSFCGLIDDARVYKRSVSEAELKAMIDGDNDGLPDWWQLKMLPNVSMANRGPNSDPDGDGILNKFEYAMNTDPLNPDTDGDLVPDGQGDSDGDGIPNDWEVLYGLNPLDSSDAGLDADSDGLTNLAEYRCGLNPTNADTDGDTIADKDEDLDQDGLPTWWEVKYGLDPTDASDADVDSDGDYLTNREEYSLFVMGPVGKQTLSSIPVTGNPLNSDTNNNGIPDGGEDKKEDYGFDQDGLILVRELRYGTLSVATDDLRDDIDEDGIPDGWEVQSGFNPRKRSDGPQNPAVVLDSDPDGNSLRPFVDADGDRMSDYWEAKYWLNPFDPSDADGDLDGDGLLNWQEYLVHTNPRKSDTDGNGINDANDDTDGDTMPNAWEIAYGLNPASASDKLADPDQDGLKNFEEYQAGTNPQKWDTDGDGMPDKWELDNGLDPLNPEDGGLDSDEDHLSNLFEYRLGLNPNNADSDGDLVSDWDEDSDGDGFPNSLLVDVPDKLPDVLNILTGTTPGALSVNADGSASYSIPIKVAVGTAGMEPKLSLSYNSGSGNGPVGLGWSLAGLSSVSRGGKSLAQNNIVTGALFDANDQFFLDGERLVRTGQTDTDGGNIYRTENDTFQQVIGYNNVFSGLSSYWKVLTKSGLTIELGATPDSRQLIGRNGVNVWSVSRITDRNGNYLACTYGNDMQKEAGQFMRDGVALIKEIAYTGNDGAALVPYARVSFIYEERPDNRTFYVEGVRLLMAARLKEIRSEVNVLGQYKTAKAYEVFYKKSALTGRSLVTAIQEFGRDKAKAFKPTEFTWQESPANHWQVANGWAPPLDLGQYPNRDAGTVLLDLNGDGYPDAFHSRQDGNGSFTQAAYINNRNGSWSASENFVIADTENHPMPLVSESGHDTGVRLADINGDGYPDLVGRGKYFYDSAEEHDAKTDDIYLGSPNGWVATGKKLAPLITDRSNDLYTASYFADVDGDGRTDVISTGRFKNLGFFFVNTFRSIGGGAFSSGEKYTWAGSNTPGMFGVNSAVQDLNGDGLPDLFANFKGKTAAWSNRGGSFKNGESLPISAAFAKTYENADDGFLDMGGRFVDLNGDGLVDYLHNIAPGTGGLNVALLNTGKGWAGAKQWKAPSFISRAATQTQPGVEVDPDDWGVRFADLNGDGLPDFVAYRKYQSDLLQDIRINTGDGWKGDSSWTFPSPSWPLGMGNVAKDSGARLIDINADGFVDLVWRYNVGGTRNTGALLNTAKPEVIVAVKDGLEVKTEVEYDVLTSQSALSAFGGEKLYTKGSGSTYPVVDNAEPMLVVKKVVNDTGLGTAQAPETRATHYQYGGMKSHVAGRGRLGFAWMKTFDELAQVETTTTLHQDEPLPAGWQGLVYDDRDGGKEYSRAGLVKTTEVRLRTPNNGNVLLSKTSNVWVPVVKGVLSRTYFAPALSESTVESYDLTGGLISKVRTYGNTYDGWGNLTDSTVDSGGGYSKETHNIYGPTDDDVRLGRLTSARVVHHAPGTPDIERKSGFAYDPNSKKLNQEIVEPGNALNATTDYEFDSFGNTKLAKVTAKDFGETGVQITVTRGTATVFDTRGRFAKEAKVYLDGYDQAVQNPRLLVTSTTYDDALGVPLEVTDPNGLKAKFTNSDGSPAYDEFGRNLVATDAQNVKTQTEYLWASSYAEEKPPGAVYFVRSTVRAQGSAGISELPSTITWYDRLARPIRKQTTTAKNQAGTSGGKKVYIDTIYDSKGRSWKISEPYFAGGTPLFTITQFDDMDRPIHVDAPNGGVTTMVYEPISPTGPNAGRGLKTTVTELQKAGVNTTIISHANQIGKVYKTTDSLNSDVLNEYDAVGNLVKVTAPGNVITQMHYDSLGRKDQVTDPHSGQVTYVINGFGEAYSEENAKMQKTIVVRDGSGRVKTKVQKDNPNDPLRYPDRRIQYTYDTAPKGTGFWLGKLRNVTLEAATYGTHSVASCDDTLTYDSLGRVLSTTRVIGGGLSYTSSNTYDEFGRVETGTYPSGLTVRNTYTNGTLTQIENVDTPVQPGTAVYWKAPDLNEVTARGQWLQESLGAVLGVTNSYRAGDGLLMGRNTVNGSQTIQSVAYDFDFQGNLLKREDNHNALQPLREDFTYDVLNRLETATISGNTRTYVYSANGNLTGKPGLGTLLYDNAARPHAVSAVRLGNEDRALVYDALGNVTSGPAFKYLNGQRVHDDDAHRTLEYWQNNKPEKITQSGTELSFDYGANDELLVQFTANSPVPNRQFTRTLFVGGGYEEVEHLNGFAIQEIEQRHSIAGVAVVTHRRPDRLQAITARSTQYLLKDHLGSTEVVTDDVGVVVSRFSYDAWGERRDAGTWAVALTPIYDPLYSNPKNFTGHQGLDDIGLVHMGGRVYDPVLGRCLSADPVAQAPELSQSHNRYSYVMNNPLSMTDPTGYSWLSSFFKKIGNALVKFAETKINWLKQNWRTVVVVAAAIVVTVVTAYAATPALGAFWGGVVAGAAGGATNGALSTALYGGTASKIFQNALRGAAIGAVTAGLTFGVAHGVPIPGREVGGSIFGEGFGGMVATRAAEGVIGGAASAAGGGDFLSGFIGSFVGGFTGGAMEKLHIEGGTRIAIGTVAAAIAGGTVAEISGGNFANGAIAAAFTYLFNEVAGEFGQHFYSSINGQRVSVWQPIIGLKFYYGYNYATGGVPGGYHPLAPGVSMDTEGMLTVGSMMVPFVEAGAVISEMRAASFSVEAAEALVLVSRWGRSGLQPNDFVMNGGVSRSTFLRSFKWDPNPSNIRVPFRAWRSGEAFKVPRYTLEAPKGWESFKHIYGQRIYKP